MIGVPGLDPVQSSLGVAVERLVGLEMMGHRVEMIPQSALEAYCRADVANTTMMRLYFEVYEWVAAGGMNS